jgi:hypothetical protein
VAPAIQVDPQGGRRAHPFGDRPNLSAGIEQQAVAFEYPRDGQYGPLIRQAFTRSSFRQQDVGNGVIDMRLEQRRRVAPFGDDPQLRVIFEVGGFLRFEVTRAQRRQPGDDGRR